MTDIRQLICLTACLLAFTGAALSQDQPADKPEPPAAKETPEQAAARWIAQLGAPAYKAREQAMRELAKIGKPALPLLKQALAKPQKPEVKQRLEALIASIAPEDRFRPLLGQLARGEVPLAKVIAKLRTILPTLPKTATPQPAWTLEILTQHEQMARMGGTSSGISWLNYFLLLREAGFHSEKIRGQAIQALLDSGEQRGTRLAGVLTLITKDGKPSDEVKAKAAKLWKKGLEGVKADDRMNGFYLEYEIGMYKLWLGDKKGALEHLGKAAKAAPTHAEEAKKSGDYYPLKKDPAFRKLVDPPAGDAEKKKQPKKKAVEIKPMRGRRAR